jgi:hypothetical protein
MTSTSDDIPGNLHAMIDAAIGEPDPVLSNLKIHTWAVWASKKAGVTIRQEDITTALRDATWVAGGSGALLGFLVALATSSWLSLAPVASVPGIGLGGIGAAIGAFTGALLGRAVARYSRRRASQLIIAGNRFVLEDIGRQTVLFYERFVDGSISSMELAAFLAAMRPGAAEVGGHDVLRETFTHYANAAKSVDAKSKHEYTYLGNCFAFLNEQIKLQPFIQTSLPFIVSKCVTERIISLDVGERQLAVSEDVPPLNGVPFPPSLASPVAEELKTFLGRWNRAKSALVGTRAGNWVKLDDRMGYVINLFRCYHLDDSVSVAPYTPEQSAAIAAGAIPSGKL